MAEGPDYEATKEPYWRRVENRRKVGIIAAVAVALLGIAVVVALSATGPGESGAVSETTGTITPAEETSETTYEVPSLTETATAPGETPAGADAVPTPAPGRASLVAYRREGWLRVAAEDGTGERAVVASAGGVHTLSPDGTLIAFVDAASGTLSLAEVASGAALAVGPATQDPPSWAPDSSWLVYTAPGPKVMRVNRFGTGASEVFAGSIPSVSVYDTTVVGLAPDGQVVVWRPGTVSRVKANGTVTGLATNGADIYYGSMAGNGAPSLHAMATNGSGERTVVAGPGSSRAVTFGDLLLSPTTAQIVYTERSDDGYSRLFALVGGSGEPTELSLRRDCYPLRWTADGAAIMYIEGNAFQGDPTALMRVLPTGASRRLLVNGADR